METLLTPEVAFHLMAIRELCVEFGVVRLEVFGSAADGTFDPIDSDVDFIVEFGPEFRYGPWGSRFDEFEDRLAEILDRPVDVLTPSQLGNPFFIRSVNMSRKLVFAA